MNGINDTTQNAPSAIAYGNAPKPQTYGADDTSANEVCRTFRNACYMADIDNYQFEFMQNGVTRSVCFIDWKHPNTPKIDLEQASLKAVRDLANREEVPFFIVVNYTKPSDGFASNMMFRVIPATKRAHKAARDPQTGKFKAWYTPREFATLMVGLRKNKPATVNVQHLQHNPPATPYTYDGDIDYKSIMSDWDNEL